MNVGKEKPTAQAFHNGLLHLLGVRRLVVRRKFQILGIPSIDVAEILCLGLKRYTGSVIRLRGALPITSLRRGR